MRIAPTKKEVSVIFVKLPCHVVNNRLVFCSLIFDEMDLQICVHGEKLRWTCDACTEYFAKRRR